MHEGWCCRQKERIIGEYRSTLNYGSAEFSVFVHFDETDITHMYPLYFLIISDSKYLIVVRDDKLRQMIKSCYEYLLSHYFTGETKGAARYQLEDCRVS